MTKFKCHSYGIVTIALIGCSLALIGCTSTVAPKLAESAQASFDQGSQNSGILSENEDHSLVVTPHFRDRFNGLVDLYGAAFHPPLVHDAGLAPTGTNNTFVITAETFEHFAAMNRWRKQGTPAWFH
jgi:hypothetical protein